MTNNSLNKIKGYLGIANRANYVIFGADKLKGYTHKLYLVLYREDFGKTIIKVVNEFKDALPTYQLSAQDFNFITNAENCKLLAIKNKGLAEQIIKILRSESISG
ncbi:MAG: hypothetical protein IJ318_02195 [Clostridia bacterium]|nr:hypothetical protein [Clostridia bacterium]